MTETQTQWGAAEGGACVSDVDIDGYLWLYHKYLWIY